MPMTTMENIDRRPSGDDRNVSGILYLGQSDAVSYRCDLVGFSKGQERENSCKTAENQMKRKEKANENL